jgi:hypothetical protein
MSQSIASTRPGLTLPDPWECPQTVAEAIWDVRNRQDGYHTHKFLREKYGTENFFMLAVEMVYEVNSWTLTQAEKKQFRKIYRETSVGDNVWKGNVQQERRDATAQPKGWGSERKWKKGDPYPGENK